MEIDSTASEMQVAHATIGGFIVRCSLLDYRLSQFMARWFCAQDKQKFLSYTMKAMPFYQKRQVIEERLSNWHSNPDELRMTMSEIASVLERRDLVANGVLSRRSSGALCIKSFSGARFISEPGAIDIVNVADISQLSECAVELSERLIALGAGLRESAE